jgi:hypothetical protein
MSPSDPVVVREIPVIHQIIKDETWLEGERRGCPVPASDTVVKENVCRVVLTIGQQLRDSIEKQLAATETGTAAGPGESTAR